MKIDRAAVAKVVYRLRNLRRRPPLFHDGVTPDRIGKRLARIRAWCGICEWAVICDYEHRRRDVEPGKATLTRQGWPTGIIARMAEDTA